MKLTVINWLKDASITFIGRIIEILFRIILFLLPLGVYLLLIQHREKASSTSNISVFLNDESRWQHIFPGFILVTINHRSFQNSFLKIRAIIQAWISNNKYIIGLLFMIAVVVLMLVSGVAK